MSYLWQLIFIVLEDENDVYRDVKPQEKSDNNDLNNNVSHLNQEKYSSLFFKEQIYSIIDHDYH